MDNFNLPNRQSIRLNGYDYSTAGYYYITICTNNRKNIFGTVNEGKVELSICGQIVKEEWLNLAITYNNVALDQFIVMPNHLHGIIILKYKNEITLGDIICRYKSITTRKYNKLENIKGKLIWQINYHENILRDERELHQRQRYIIQNPLNWENDNNYNI